MKVGYNVGDVVGIAKVAQFLFTSDNTIALHNLFDRHTRQNKDRGTEHSFWGERLRAIEPSSNRLVMDDFPRT